MKLLNIKLLNISRKFKYNRQNSDTGIMLINVLGGITKLKFLEVFIVKNRTNEKLKCFCGFLIIG